MAEGAANYHISLWAEPPGYLCLLCVDKPPVLMPLADILLHLPTVHNVDAVPTPLAADPSILLPSFGKETADAPGADVHDHD